MGLTSTQQTWLLNHNISNLPALVVPTCYLGKGARSLIAHVHYPMKGARNFIAHIHCPMKGARMYLTAVFYNGLLKKPMKITRHFDHSMHFLHHSDSFPFFPSIINGSASIPHSRATLNILERKLQCQLRLAEKMTPSLQSASVRMKTS